MSIQKIEEAVTTLTSSGKLTEAQAVISTVLLTGMIKEEAVPKLRRSLVALQLAKEKIADREFMYLLGQLGMGTEELLEHVRALEESQEEGEEANG